MTGRRAAKTLRLAAQVGHQLNRCGAGGRAPCDNDASDGEHDGETDCHVPPPLNRGLGIPPLILQSFDTGSSSPVQVCFNESKTKLHWLEERVRLVMHHPALLG